MLVGWPGIRLEDVLVADAVAFSAAINENVRRIWGKAAL
jgi:hypothetical protein